MITIVIIFLVLFIILSISKIIEKLSNTDENQIDDYHF
ncbi:MAG: hypothetical protein KatS3mg002_1092 [Candidatus Woesearchaeota archaeon]|jgi:lipopolysaccharide export LptBFGC system permease protein LptF|nr:MAG: hypothetical protein KatS3mg002_1092 [Candidatus Woesearchaeota archaeon]